MLEVNEVLFGKFNTPAMLPAKTGHATIQGTRNLNVCITQYVFYASPSVLNGRLVFRPWVAPAEVRCGICRPV